MCAHHVKLMLLLAQIAKSAALTWLSIDELQRQQSRMLHCAGVLLTDPHATDDSSRFVLHSEYQQYQDVATEEEPEYDEA